MALAFYEVTDPFEFDFGLQAINKDYIADKPLKEYFEEEMLFFKMDEGEIDYSYIPEDGESFVEAQK
jgi:hypothetical protein